MGRDEEEKGTKIDGMGGELCPSEGILLALEAPFPSSSSGLGPGTEFEGKGGEGSDGDDESISSYVTCWEEVGEEEEKEEEEEEEEEKEFVDRWGFVRKPNETPRGGGGGGGRIGERPVSVQEAKASLQAKEKESER
jgi:hypothetical protein